MELTKQYRDDGSFVIKEVEAYRSERCKELFPDRKVRLKTLAFIEEVTGCWPCVSHKSKWYRDDGTGYPMVGYPGEDRQYFQSVINLIYTTLNGPLPDGQKILHRCDNHECCNPSHVYLGTSFDNARDRVARNIESYQVKSNRLTVEQIKLIHDHPEVTGRELAKTLHKSSALITAIRHGRVYRAAAWTTVFRNNKLRHVQVPLPPEYQFGGAKTLNYDARANHRAGQARRKKK